MTEGCYDLDGKCMNCGKFHPCDCEFNNIDNIDEIEQDRARYEEEKSQWEIDQMQEKYQQETSQ